MIRVLLTGGGGAGTIEVLRSLRRAGAYELIAADASPTAVGFALADRGYVIPFGAADEFEPAMRELIQREHPDFVVPLVDEEIPKVHALSRDPRLPPFRIVAPRPEFCDRTLDKWAMAEDLVANRLPVATTWLASAARAASYPAIIKPRRGRGSRGLAFLDGPDDLAAYLRTAASAADQYIVQERLQGREFTASVVCGLGGPVLAVVPKQAVDKRGITQVGVTRAVAAIDALGRDIQDRLRADGPFNVQLVLGDDGVPRVFEINPRYSTTVALTLAAGVDEVDAVLRHARGEDPGPLRFAPDLMMIRYTAQHYVNERDWRPVDLRSHEERR